jgi:hypothetical protein
MYGQPLCNDGRPIGVLLAPIAGERPQTGEVFVLGIPSDNGEILAAINDPSLSNPRLPPRAA